MTRTGMTIKTYPRPSPPLKLRLSLVHEDASCRPSVSRMRGAAPEVPADKRGPRQMASPDHRRQENGPASGVLTRCRLDWKRPGLILRASHRSAAETEVRRGGMGLKYRRISGAPRGCPLKERTRPLGGSLVLALRYVLAPLAARRSDMPDGRLVEANRVAGAI